MGRIIEIEGRKVEIPNASFSIPFTDKNGKYYEFDGYAFHNPLAHKAFGWTTIQSVLKWWVENREELIALWKEQDYFVFMMDRLEIYFDYLSRRQMCEESLENLKSALYGCLRKKSLRVVFGSNMRGSSEFVLLDNSSNSEEDIPLVNIDMLYLGRIEVYERERASATSNDKWTQHYNYSFRMPPSDFNWFRSVNNENTVMFGMELEISSRLSTSEIQAIVRDVEPKQEPFFIFKQDSSISGCYDHSLELVTVPCTPRYLRTHWKIFFQKLDKLCRAKGMSIGDVIDTRNNLSNGLHIHVDRDSFNDQPHYNKFLTAWNQWSKSVVNLFNVVSERPTDYSRHGYCKINRSYDGLMLSRRLKGLRCDDRMSVAHNNTSQTIEVRLYQGIFNIGHIMKCISFTEAVFEFCKNMGYSNFDRNFVPSLSKFVRKERKYASLYNIFEKAAAK